MTPAGDACDIPLRKAVLAPDPFEQWARWYAEAQAAGQPEPEAMTLATATTDGIPSVRWVLLKGVDDRGFAFYTNEASRKGLELAANPVAALAWRWSVLNRQVRVSGPVERVDDEQADRYFATRARGSQLGAWASDQSRPLSDRGVLEARLAEVEARFPSGPVPRPPWWCGFRVVAEEIEFWQDRRDRLHDRLVYQRVSSSAAAAAVWTIERLSP